MVFHYPPPPQIDITYVAKLASPRKFGSYQDWKNQGEPIAGNIIPANYGKIRKLPLRLGSENDLQADISREELDSLRIRLHNTLWGGGASSDTDIFNLLTRLILAKLNDEQSITSATPYEFQFFDGEDPIKDTIPRLDLLYRRSLTSRLSMSAEEAKSRNIRDAEKGTPAQIRYAIEQLEQYSLTEIAKSPHGSDLLGGFFENIIRTGFKQSKGQFFTHTNIVRFIIDVLGLEELTEQRVRAGSDLPYLIDPSAGSGTFLIYAMMAMADALDRVNSDGSTLSSSSQDYLATLLSRPASKNAWAADYLYGMEINPDIGLAAQVNMMLHSDGSSSILAGADKGDGLAAFSDYNYATPRLHWSEPVSGYSHRVNGQFDIVLTNPPYSVKYSVSEMERIRRVLSIAEQTQKSEDLFIDRWFQLLKPGGRVAAVVPDSLLDGKKKTAGRQFLLDRFWIKAIVSLPADAFYPYTSTKTSVLFAQKKVPSEVRSLGNKKIWFAKAMHLGYRRTTKREFKVDRNDLLSIAQCLKEAELWDV